MQSHPLRSQPLRSVPVIILALLLAACGATSTATTGASATTMPSPVATSTHTSTPTSTPTPTQVTVPCGNETLTGIRVGDLVVGTAFGNLAYPEQKLPDGTPLQPLHIQYGPSQTGVALSQEPYTNPNMTVHVGGYELRLCNTAATQAHMIQSVAVRIRSVDAYTGRLSEWQFCNEPYNAQTSQALGGGCGGAYTAAEYLRATFPASAGVGASATATQVSSGSQEPGNGFEAFGPLPVSLKPNTYMPINVGMTPPTTPATYIFEFTIQVDGVASPPIASPPTLLAPVAHDWTGQACTSSSMQSQIPQASNPTFYICPAQ